LTLPERHFEKTLPPSPVWHASGRGFSFQVTRRLVEAIAHSLIDLCKVAPFLRWKSHHQLTPDVSADTFRRSRRCAERRVFATKICSCPIRPCRRVALVAWPGPDVSRPVTSHVGPLLSSGFVFRASFRLYPRDLPSEGCEDRDGLWLIPRLRLSFF
jgi:hypothetical protein